MIKLLKLSALIFVIMTLALIGGACLLPSTFEVTREITIQRSPQEVYSILSDLEKWQPWDPWQKKDSGLTLAVKARTLNGMQGEWRRDGESEGQISLVQSEPLVRMDIALHRINSPKRLLVFNLKDLGGKTRLTWTLSGENGMYPFGNIFALQMDRYVGPVYEEALQNLKRYAEQSSTAQ